MSLGERIQNLRRRNGMSQDVLAEKLEVSRQAVSKWERDEAVPETDKIIRIAQLFSVSTDYLLLQEQPRPQERPRQGRPTAADRVERFLRRHGYKGGYLLMGYGAATSAVCLLFRWIWHSAVSGMTGSFGSAVDGMGSGFGGGMLEIPGAWSPVPGDMFGGVADTADSMGQMAMNWGNVFLIGLVPGVALIALGIVVLIKGKQISQKAQQ